MQRDNDHTNDEPPLDPFEAELVAYLDGELDEAASRKIEVRLAKDPAARAHAAALKKSFDLLDYLPSQEPSTTFTSRTLDKLPTVRHAATASTSTPIPLDEFPQAARLRVPRAAGIAAAVVVFLTIGYLASALTRTYFFKPRPILQVEEKHEPTTRVIEHLPLYAVVDNLQFLVELAQPDSFGDDPSVVYDPTLRPLPGDSSEKPSGDQFELLANEFRKLPGQRQKEILQFDKELHAKEPKDRDRLLRVLEAYATWLERLTEGERRKVLAAATPSERLKYIQNLREKQWFDSLPPSVRANREQLQQWKEEEATRRDRLAFIRQHAEAFAANKSPWPFDTEEGRKQVIEYARTVLKVDEANPRRWRLSSAARDDYKRRLEAAERDDSWAWYGLTVYELSRDHPYLPESDSSKLMITEISELPEPYQSRANPKKGFGIRPRLSMMGKWPDFPLEVLREIPLRESPMFKGPLPPLGPSRISEYKQPVRDFANKELFPKMTNDEQREIQRLEGKWPDHSQRLLFYARKYDLSVPGVTLPGSPKKWETTYGTRKRP